MLICTKVISNHSQFNSKYFQKGFFLKDKVELGIFWLKREILA